MLDHTISSILREKDSHWVWRNLILKVGQSHYQVKILSKPQVCEYLILMRWSWFWVYLQVGFTIYCSQGYANKSLKSLLSQHHFSFYQTNKQTNDGIKHVSQSLGQQTKSTKCETIVTYPRCSLSLLASSFGR